MKSPICYLCNVDFGSEYFHAQTGGALVKFDDYEPLGEGFAGHPQGLEWFCRHHLQAAQELASLTTDEALLRLRDRYGEFPPYVSKPIRDPELWVTSIGSYREKVFIVIRQATYLSPRDARNLLRAGSFKVAAGWPSSFESWRIALIDAGAQVEVRFP